MKLSLVSSVTLIACAAAARLRDKSLLAASTTGQEELDANKKPTKDSKLVVDAPLRHFGGENSSDRDGSKGDMRIKRPSLLADFYKEKRKRAQLKLLQSKRDVGKTSEGSDRVVRQSSSEDASEREQDSHGVDEFVGDDKAEVERIDKDNCVKEDNGNREIVLQKSGPLKKRKIDSDQTNLDHSKRPKFLSTKALPLSTPLEADIEERDEGREKVEECEHTNNEDEGGEEDEGEDDEEGEVDEEGEEGEDDEDDEDNEDNKDNKGNDDQEKKSVKKVPSPQVRHYPTNY